MIDPISIIQQHKGAESMRLNMCSIWRDVAAHADPLDREIGIDSTAIATPSISNGVGIYDSTIKTAAQVYASGACRG
jgi:predicted hotdog family 3-hydroxylacyl-ACP dehydratase